MKKYNIPTAAYAVCEDSASAIDYIKAQGAPIVVKADGLALGKGVPVAMTEEEAIAAVKDAIDGHAFGGAGARVVIEEYLTGPEVSVLAFVDGKHLKTMPSAQTTSARMTTTKARTPRHGRVLALAVLHRGRHQDLHGDHFPAHGRGDGSGGPSVQGRGCTSA